jgi:CheY-like chemotaxis protein
MLDQEARKMNDCAQPDALRGAELVCNRPVLVVDDDGDLLETIGQVVADEARHAVVYAKNGAEALDFLLKPDFALPCLIVLDLMMPVVNGWQVLSFCRTHDAWAKIPVIVVSASMNDQTLEDAHAARFLRKPVALQDLVALVLELCAARPPDSSS